MDWSKAKTALVQIAPWIAGTLGSPVAGVAVKALCDVFNLSGNASSSDVVAALSGATPEQLATLKDAELKHQEFMQQIGYKALTDLEATAAADRDSARKMQIAAPSNVPAALTILLTVGMLVIVGVMMAGVKIQDNPIAMMLFGSLTTGWTTSLSYWLGTTRGSGNKDALLAQSQPGGQS
jgi:hypothetical protein